MENHDIVNAGRQLFARINTVKAENGQTEKLDEKEIAQAKSFGFSLFNLEQNMNEEQFIKEYAEVKFANEQEEDAFIQQERNIHVKYLQLQYKTTENIMEDETIEDFEARLAEKNPKDKILNKIVPDFGFEVTDKKQQKGKPRISYGYAMTLLRNSGQMELNRRRDGGSTYCTVDTPEGKLTIYLNNTAGSKKNGYITVTYPDKTMEIITPNNELATNTEEDFSEEEVKPQFEPNPTILGSPEGTSPEDILMNLIKNKHNS